MNILEFMARRLGLYGKGGGRILTASIWDTRADFVEMPQVGRVLIWSIGHAGSTVALLAPAPLAILTDCRRVQGPSTVAYPCLVRPLPLVERVAYEFDFWGGGGNLVEQRRRKIAHIAVEEGSRVLPDQLHRPSPVLSGFVALPAFEQQDVAKALVNDSRRLKRQFITIGFHTLTKLLAHPRSSSSKSLPGVCSSAKIPRYPPPGHSAHVLHHDR